MYRMDRISISDWGALALFMVYMHVQFPVLAVMGRDGTMFCHGLEMENRGGVVGGAGWGGGVDVGSELLGAWAGGV
jgi:hypothetical protein